MPNPTRSLKVFIYHTQSDWETVQALAEQLTLNGIQVVLPEDVQPIVTDGKLGNEQNRFQQVVQQADIVLFCLSEQFNKLDALKYLAWRPVLEEALKKRQGDLYVITLRLHNCAVPAGLKRWQPINLYKRDGYEELMHAFKLRADQRGVILTQFDDWKDNPFVNEPEEEQDEILDTEDTQQNTSILLWGSLLVVLLIAGLFFFQAGFRKNQFSATQTMDSVDVLAQRATQNVIASSTARAATVTAEVVDYNETNLQTEVFLTSVPITKTAVAAQALITPTITLTSVTLPTAIIDAGDVPMVLVPQGNFIMGQDDDPNAKPAHSVDLPNYYMDQYEVSNVRYQECVNAGACKPPTLVGSQTHPDYYLNSGYANYPVLNIDWFGAQTYCTWRGARLPTEAEWEKAARGTNALIQPWGDETGCFFANHNKCVGDTTAIDKYAIGRSIYGVFNLAGNAEEWTSSIWMPYPYNASDGREDAASKSPRVLRGGSWASPPAEILTYYRVSLDPLQVGLHGNDVGFRCVRSAQ